MVSGLRYWYIDSDNPYTDTSGTWITTSNDSTDSYTTCTWFDDGFYTDEYDDEKIIENKYKTKNHALPPQKRGDLFF